MKTPHCGKYAASLLAQQHNLCLYHRAHPLEGSPMDSFSFAVVIWNDVCGVLQPE